jgi:transcription elongation factor Elf1
MEKNTNQECPRCGQPEMNVYYADQSDNRVGAWCEYCNMKAYYNNDRLVEINS